MSELECSTGQEPHNHHCYVLKKPGLDPRGAQIEHLLAAFGVRGVHARTGYRYVLDTLTGEQFADISGTVLAEAPVNDILDHAGFAEVTAGKTAPIGINLKPGQYNEMADNAIQCIDLNTGVRPNVQTTEVIAFDGVLAPEIRGKLARYLINPTDSEEVDLSHPVSLREAAIGVSDRIPILEGFEDLDEAGLQRVLTEQKLAMTLADLRKVQTYFRSKGRSPTETELRVIDTYWSDHCRHTTFTTQLTSIRLDGTPIIENGRCEDRLAYTPLSPSGQAIARAAAAFMTDRSALFGPDAERRRVSLMELALFSMREARAQGLLDDLECSEENNAASLIVPVEFADGHREEWLLMLKNETHNHPTEIEPYGGAATCLGGAIRDPLSGRSYVIMGIRVTGSGDPRTPLEQTLPGKLPQQRITTGAAEGFRSYGNQIGVPTLTVREYYHEGYTAKHMETGVVAGTVPRDHVVREVPRPGDKIILLGGRTGRDGIGGASGSSVVHTEDSVATRGAEVQKGNPVLERHIQRLFRDPVVSRMIKRCNDFGAGGVSVAIGEVADGSDIDLDSVPLKYTGLNGTEIAISESQERMAAVVSAADADAFIAAAAAENLEATVVADVTEERVLRMRWKGQTICELDREFLASGWAERSADVALRDPGYVRPYFTDTPREVQGKSLTERWFTNLGRLNVASQRGMQQGFDATVGANTVVGPFGGAYQCSPSEAAVVRFPAEGARTRFAVAESCDPNLSSRSPYHGGMYAVVDAIAKLVASGAAPQRVRLTLQNYFGKLTDPSRWSQPFLAQLGAREAQKHLRAPAIGGKDSMSGTFLQQATGERLDVPPTLLCFATSVLQKETIIPSCFQEPRSTVVALTAVIEESGEPDWQQLQSMWQTVHALQHSGAIHSAHAIHAGGAAAVLTEMCLGNRIGLRIIEPALDHSFFAPAYGSIIVELREGEDPATLFARLPHTVLGTTMQSRALRFGNGIQLPLKELQEAWEKPLDAIFPLLPKKQSTEEHHVPLIPRLHHRRKAPTTTPKPRVSVLTFPGTNCEYETIAAFNRAGAIAQEVLFLNRTQRDIRESILWLVSAIRDSQIVVIPGGFSAGDQPDGSAKYIASVLRNERIRGILHEHVTQGNLVLGICNGFQALVKSCLLPTGKIREQRPTDATLTHNTIGHFLSMHAMHRVGSLRSPWMIHFDDGELADFPIGHGEGRLINTSPLLIENEHVPFYYCDRDGNVRSSFPANPNGSDYNIAALTDPTGLIFGMMAHPERATEGLSIHVPSQRKGQRLFRGGVDYFA